MAILETIRENIETVSQSAAEIAKKTAEALRLREQIRRDNKEIRKLTYEIGQTYLRLHADDYDEVYKEFVDGIAAARIDIEEKRDQLAKLREKQAEAELLEGDILVAEDETWDDLFESEPVEETAEAVEELAEEAEELAEETEEAAKTAEELAEEAGEAAAEAAEELAE